MVLSRGSTLIDCVPDVHGFFQKLPRICLVTSLLTILIIAWHWKNGEAVSVQLLNASSDNQRQLDAQRFLKALEDKPKAPVQIVVADNDAEAFQLALQFQRLLQIATWKVSDLVRVSQRDLMRLANRPGYWVEEDQLVGISIAVVAESPEDFEVAGDREADTPLNALMEAILDTLGSVDTYAAGKNFFPAPPSKTLRLVVGSQRPSSAPRR